MQREHETGIYERWAYVYGLDEGHELFLDVTRCSLVEIYKSMAEPPAETLDFFFFYDTTLRHTRLDLHYPPSCRF